MAHALPVLSSPAAASAAPPAFSRAAPEPSAAPSVFALRPDELRARGFLGDPAVLFGRLQRPAAWHNGQPQLGRAAAHALIGTDFSRPVLVEQHPSTDGSTRCVLMTSDHHAIEAVHMPRATRTPRTTLCISSQVGCAMGCTFCATGTMGIVRNLTAGEIVGEVLTLMDALGPNSAHATTLVFMGMGEPLHNRAHVKAAVELLCDPRGLGFSKNRITVSTSGLLPGIEDLATWPVRPLLALSVNATTDATRSRIMPINRAFGLDALKRTLHAFPFRPGEKVLLEYVLLRGENDTADDARRLAAFAAGLPHNINVIPLNAHALTAHEAPDQDTALAFARALQEHGCLVTVRKNRGRDVRGACGQLVQARQAQGPNTP